MSTITWNLPRTNNPRTDAVLKEFCDRIRRRFEEMEAALALKATITQKQSVLPIAVTFVVPTQAAVYTP